MRIGSKKEIIQYRHDRHIIMNHKRMIVRYFSGTRIPFRYVWYKTNAYDAHYLKYNCN
jgi:hypothetical protein